jgi:hypothetical protein
LDPDPLVRGADPRILIRVKMSRIPNTGIHSKKRCVCVSRNVRPVSFLSVLRWRNVLVQDRQAWSFSCSSLIYKVCINSCVGAKCEAGCLSERVAMAECAGAGWAGLELGGGSGSGVGSVIGSGPDP